MAIVSREEVFLEEWPCERDDRVLTEQRRQRWCNVPRNLHHPGGEEGTSISCNRLIFNPQS